MSTIRQAACIILLRPCTTGPDPFEIYLVQRAKHLSFLGGFHAFAGGCVDPSDHNLARDYNLDAQQGPFQIAAVRELFEEVGVLAIPEGNTVHPQELKQLQQQVHQSSSTLAAWLHQHKIQLNTQSLISMGHWITPPYNLQRYDTWYFTCWLPTGQTPCPVTSELIDGQWFSPADAIHAHEEGRLFISYPVLETIKVLNTHQHNLDAASQAMADVFETQHAQRGGELLTGIGMIPVKTYTLPPATHTNCYVIGGQRLVIIDPATPIADEQQILIATLERWSRERQAPLSEIWLTHEHKDHIGAVNVVREHFDIPVAAHRLTANALANQIHIDRHIEDQEMTTLPLANGQQATWTAIHTPGHAQGHLCFYEQTLGSLITGDLVLGLGSVLIAPPDGNMSDYLHSLHQLLNLDPLGFLLPAHGPPVALAAEKIQSYIDHRLKREQSIWHALEQALSRQELTTIVYSDVDPILHPLAELNVQAHLEKLLNEGRILQHADKYIQNYSNNAP